MVKQQQATTAWLSNSRLQQHGKATTGYNSMVKQQHAILEPRMQAGANTILEPRMHNTILEPKQCAFGRRSADKNIRTGTVPLPSIDPSQSTCRPPLATVCLGKYHGKTHPPYTLPLLCCHTAGMVQSLLKDVSRPDRIRL
jgi:hypothetical protein